MAGCARNTTPLCGNNSAAYRTVLSTQPPYLGYFLNPLKKEYDMNQTVQKLVHFSNNRLVTTSLDIAQNFGKKHAHVLRDIENLECSQSFRESNFGLSSYISNQNKELPMYEITRDGFVFLCMGFTGASAAYWKERYIQAFNQMEHSLWHNHVQLQALKSAYLHANPDAEKLLRYVQMDLNHVEIGKLLGVSGQTVRDRLKKLAQMGLADYVPNPKYQHPRTLGHHVQTQLALEV